MTTAAAAFWTWLHDHQAELRAVVGDAMTGDEPILDDLLAALQAFDDGLYFLLGGERDGTVELIITAEGDSDRFPAVRALVDAAPPLPGWEVIAFKPALGFDVVIRHDRATIDAKAAWFLPLASRAGHFAVRVACAEYVAADEDDFAFAAQMMIDAGLGERVASGIHHIDVVAAPASPAAEGFLRLSELPGYMTFRASRLPS
jgi:hypothetical protein